MTAMCLVWVTEGEDGRGEIDSGGGRDLGGAAGKMGAGCSGCGQEPMERAGGHSRRQRRLPLGRCLGWRCPCGGDQDLGGRCKSEMDESTRRGITEEGRKRARS